MTDATISMDEFIEQQQAKSFSQILAEQNPPEPGIDVSQWAKQVRAVYEAMKHGRWMTKPEIAFHSGATEHAVSARLSDLNKKGFPHEKRRAGKGLVEYRLAPADYSTASSA